MTMQPPERASIGDLFCSRIPFQVPKYQRAFDWEKEEEIDDFIEDVLVLYEQRMSYPEEPRQHFFGGLVSIKQNIPNSYTRNIYGVVDGQQRLATFTLTIASLIRGFKLLAIEAEDKGDLDICQEASNHSEVTQENYLEYIEVVRSQKQPRLRLNLSRADRDFFEDLIRNYCLNPSQNLNKRPSRTIFKRDSHKKLQEALSSLVEKLIDNKILKDSALTTFEKLECLLQLQRCVTDDCYVIHIISTDRDEAYKLFDVLNDRGKTLSDGDKLRSYTLELLENHEVQQSYAEQHWDEILKYPAEEIKEFFRAYYCSNQGEGAPKRNLSDNFKENIFKIEPQLLKPAQISEARQVTKLTAALLEEQQIFIDISVGRWPYNQPTASDWQRDRLYRLIRVLKHTVCIPLLLSVRHCLAEDDFVATVDLLERFSFRYINIVGAHGGRIATVYHSHAKQIRQSLNNYKIDTLINELQQLQDVHAPDDTFESLLEQKLSYQGNSSRKMLIRHFLTTIEDHRVWCQNGANGKPKPDITSVFDLSKATIEHIYPQNADDSSQIPTLEPLKNDIGNLSFWSGSDNSKVGNKPFVDKKGFYANSNVMLNRKLSELSDWDEKTLITRKKHLIKMSKKVFTV